ncbi:MAG: lipid-A-disaccharide synthase, partial [Proteobacteria bacterium]|nr:lipid-A-disaccharide synthase [Pseudomonadota bacterium]
VEQIERLRPAVVVTIDSPDFTLRVSKKLKGKGIPLVHYVAPTVWAWKSGRAQKTAEFLDHMMALLPFEPQFFDKVGLDCTFVGHPVVDSGAKNGDGPAFRKEHGVPPNATLLCALPGSRAAEVRRLIPVFREVFDLLARDIPNLYIVMPIADGVAEEIRQATARWPAGIIFVQGEVARHDAFAASNLALAASGTVSLELAVAEVPTVITYKLNLISTYLARILVKVRFVNLINLLLDKEAIPELILEKCVPSRIAASVWTLYDDAEACSEQIANAREAIAKLTVANTSPSERAAQVVLAHVTVPSFAGWRAP